MPVPKLSVIIPVYNAAVYVEQCIGSVLAQTLNEIEVIAVNDGSTDESASILDRLAAGDDRLRVYHQPNRGVSAARNFGLSKARGPYIGFCDADDWTEPDMYARMLEAMEQHAVDWVVCNVAVEQEGHSSQQRLQIIDQKVDYSNSAELMIRDLMRFRYDNANWNKLYKASLINQHRLLFDESMQVWEDLLFNLSYASVSDSLYCLQACFYHYRVIPSSLTQSLKKDSLLYYNRLYAGYEQFAKQHFLHKNEWMVFREEMGRGCYYYLLHELAMQTIRHTNGVLEFIKYYSRQLGQLQTDIFYFPPQQKNQVSAIKKRLLTQKKFRLFAILVWFSKNRGVSRSQNRFN